MFSTVKEFLSLRYEDAERNMRTALGTAQVFDVSSNFGKEIFEMKDSCKRALQALKASLPEEDLEDEEKDEKRDVKSEKNKVQDLLRDLEKVRKDLTEAKEKCPMRILAYCLMPNHYHLIVYSAKDNGIPIYMQKLNLGFAKYYNLKNKEDLVGHLVTCMAPHNCAGVICRIIGFSKVQSQK